MVMKRFSWGAGQHTKATRATGSERRSQVSEAYLRIIENMIPNLENTRSKLAVSKGYD